MANLREELGKPDLSLSIFGVGIIGVKLPSFQLMKAKIYADAVVEICNPFGEFTDEG